MSNFTVAQISEADAQKLNNNKTDDNKQAFQNASGTEYYTYPDIARNAGMQYLTITLSQAVGCVLS